MGDLNVQKGCILMTMAFKFVEFYKVIVAYQRPAVAEFYASTFRIYQSKKILEPSLAEIDSPLLL